MTLNNYNTGEVIREATEAEIALSEAEIAKGHAEGVIEVEINGEKISCYVD